MDKQERYRVWVLGSMMNEMDLEVFNIGGEMVPLIDLFLLLPPIIFVGPNLVQLGRPFCGKAILGPCAINDILCRHPNYYPPMELRQIH